jgi:hypothetical protein
MRAQVAGCDMPPRRPPEAPSPFVVDADDGQATDEQSGGLPTPETSVEQPERLRQFAFFRNCVVRTTSVATDAVADQAPELAPFLSANGQQEGQESLVGLGRPR